MNLYFSLQKSKAWKAPLEIRRETIERHDAGESSRSISRWRTKVGYPVSASQLLRSFRDDLAAARQQIAEEEEAAGEVTGSTCTALVKGADGADDSRPEAERPKESYHLSELLFDFREEEPEKELQAARDVGIDVDQFSEGDPGGSAGLFLDILQAERVEKAKHHGIELHQVGFDYQTRKYRLVEEGEQTGIDEGANRLRLTLHQAGDLWRFNRYVKELATQGSYMTKNWLHVPWPPGAEEEWTAYRRRLWLRDELDKAQELVRLLVEPEDPGEFEDIMAEAGGDSVALAERMDLLTEKAAAHVAYRRWIPAELLRLATEAHKLYQLIPGTYIEWGLLGVRAATEPRIREMLREHRSLIIEMCSLREDCPEELTALSREEMLSLGPHEMLRLWPATERSDELKSKQEWFLDRMGELEDQFRKETAIGRSAAQVQS